jgi:hypothetical protein
MRDQVIELLILAMPVAGISWTITHEEVFRELRNCCADKSQSCRSLYQRKFFFIFTCEYCLSHYVTAVLLILTGYKLLFDDWRGYLIAGFSMVWIANLYMSFFGRVRLEIKRERIELSSEEKRGQVGTIDDRTQKKISLAVPHSRPAEVWAHYNR